MLLVLLLLVVVVLEVLLLLLLAVEIVGAVLLLLLLQLLHLAAVQQRMAVMNGSAAAAAAAAAGAAVRAAAAVLLHVIVRTGTVDVAAGGGADGGDAVAAQRAHVGRLRLVIGDGYVDVEQTVDVQLLLDDLFAFWESIESENKYVQFDVGEGLHNPKDCELFRSLSTEASRELKMRFFRITIALNITQSPSRLSFDPLCSRLKLG